MKIDELRADLPNRITQVRQRVIRRLEDDAVVALMVGEERAAMEILAKIEALESMTSTVGAGGGREPRNSDRRAERRVQQLVRRGGA